MILEQQMYRFRCTLTCRSDSPNPRGVTFFFGGFTFYQGLDIKCTNTTIIIITTTSTMVWHLPPPLLLQLPLPLPYHYITITTIATTITNTSNTSPLHHHQQSTATTTNHHLPGFGKAVQALLTEANGSRINGIYMQEMAKALASTTCLLVNKPDTIHLYAGACD